MSPKRSGSARPADGGAAGLAAFIAFVRQHRELYRIIEESQFVAHDVYREHI
jgi:hypothetical protein